MIKRVPYDFLAEDYEKYSSIKADIETEIELEKEIEIQAINEKYDALKAEKTAVYDRLIEACTHEIEIEDEPEMVEVI